MTLGKRAARSARWAFLESLVSAGASLATVVLLARFLSPAEFGLAGLAVAVAAIVQALLLQGMPDALVRGPSAHTRLTDAMFWATTAIGAGAAGLCGLAALAIWAIGEPELAELTAVQGLTGVALGVAAAPTGLLLRKLRTRALVQRTIAAKLVTLGVSVGLAASGWGAWAVVLGNLAAQAAAAVQLVLTLPRRPRFRLAAPGLRETLRLGLLSGAQAGLGTIATRGFVLGFGAAYGPYSVGLFNFALRLAEEGCGLVIQTLRRVTVSTFAAARRAGREVAPLFRRGTGMIAAVSAPLFLGGAALAPDAVPLIFGEQWRPAVPALQVMLGIWTLRSVRMLVNAVMLVEGRQRAMVWLGVAGVAATAAAFMVSLPFGEGATIFAYAATLVGVVFGSGVFARATGIGPGAQVAAFARPLAIALVAAAAVTALRLGPLAEWEPAARLAALTAAGLTIWGGLAVALDRDNLRNVLDALGR